ncbi:MAG: pilus assembly FimT family protein [Nitrospirota bacterium]
MARLLDCDPDMLPTGLRDHAGYTVVELLVTLAVLGILGTMAWPSAADVIERTELATAARVLAGDIQHAQREARATGQRLALVVDTAAGSYTTRFPDGARRGHHLPRALTFGAPDDPESDGVTFRDNTIWVAPRPGPQSSVGALTIRTRHGAARRVTVSLTGHTAIAVWEGSRWR